MNMFTAPIRMCFYDVQFRRFVSPIPQHLRRPSTNHRLAADFFQNPKRGTK
jgi:hypothetical protein